MRALLLLAVALLVAACDSSEPTAPPQIGRFEAELSGALTRSLGGDAVLSFFPGPGGDSTAFVSMTDRGSAGQRSLSFSDAQNVLDGEGTYSLGADRLSGLLPLLYREGGAAGSFYVATSGTLRITRWSKDRIEGSFAADLAPAFGGDEDAEVSVSGTFEAVPIPLSPR